MRDVVTRSLLPAVFLLLVAPAVLARSPIVDQYLLFDKAEILSWKGDLAAAAKVFRKVLEITPIDVYVLTKPSLARSISAQGPKDVRMIREWVSGVKTTDITGL